MKKFTFLLAGILACTVSLNAQTWPPAGMNGIGDSSNPYEITTQNQLKALADYVNDGNGEATAGKYYKLMNDIELSGLGTEGWDPIGNYILTSSTFQGNFDGNGKVVKNLIIDRTSSYIGLFGRTNGAIIKNLGIEDCNVKGIIDDNSACTGALVGYNANSNISNSYATGSVSSSSSSSSDVGGLVGFNSGGTISNCYATGNVSSSSSSSYYYFSYAGGLVGFNSGTISNCYATGNVSSSAYSSSYSGGLVGENSGTISNSYATGSVSSSASSFTSSFAGGLVGENSGTINNCYATGSVSSGSSSYSCAGGLVGSNYMGGTGTVKNSVAANASVTSSSSSIANRVIGNNGGTVQNNYANTAMVVQGNGSNISQSSDLNGITGADTDIATLQTRNFYTTAGNWNGGAWDITDPSGVWSICNSEGLPFLRWQGITCENEFVIIATAGANGSILPNGNVIVNTGNTQTFTFTPATGYSVDKILVDGSAVATADSYTFTNVTENHTIHVTFKSNIGIVETLRATSLQVYPNPTTDELTIVNDENSPQTITNIEIYDITGRIVRTYRIHPENTTIDVSQLQPGVYVLKIGDYTSKFVKE